jgi:opacity protein-like surface antigen
LSSTSRNWSGYYVGGQIGYTASEFDFSGASSSLTSFMLRNAVMQPYATELQLLGKNDIQSVGFGGFVGRNWQWQDVVLGVEANYNHMSKTFSSSSNSIAREIVNPSGEFVPPNHVYRHDISLSGAAQMEIQDVMTFRARAAWAAGNFMPYGFGGLAVAYVNGSRMVTYNETRYDDFTDTSTTPATTTTTSINYPTQTAGTARSTSFIAGYTAGLGMEVALVGGLFVRGEWEYVKFLQYMDISASVGAGYKF